MGEPTAKRGGRGRRIYGVTSAGCCALAVVYVEGDLADRENLSFGNGFYRYRPAHTRSPG